MPCPGTKKCLCCHIFFKPTPQSKGRQNYCSKPQCKKASKKASQKKWLSKPENSHYFKDADNVQRVQQWRTDKLNYCKKSKKHSTDVDGTDKALQDTLTMQSVDKYKKIDILNKDVLQERLISQVFVLTDLIAHLDVSALLLCPSCWVQEMIAFIRQKDDNLAITLLTKFHQLKGDYNELSSFTKPQQMPGNTASI